MRRAGVPSLPIIMPGPVPALLWLLDCRSSFMTTGASWEGCKDNDRMSPSTATKDPRQNSIPPVRPAGEAPTNPKQTPWGGPLLHGFFSVSPGGSIPNTVVAKGRSPPLPSVLFGPTFPSRDFLLPHRIPMDTPEESPAGSTEGVHVPSHFPCSLPPVSAPPRAPPGFGLGVTGAASLGRVDARSGTRAPFPTTSGLGLPQKRRPSLARSCLQRPTRPRLQP